MPICAVTIAIFTNLAPMAYFHWKVQDQYLVLRNPATAMTHLLFAYN